MIKSIAALLLVVMIGGAMAQSISPSQTVSGYSVISAGAVCNGVTDDTAAINTALSSGHQLVTVPAGVTCYSATGITVPATVTLSGLSFTPASVPSGSTILCASTVTRCITNGGSEISELVVISNASGSSYSGVGIYNSDGNNVVNKRTWVGKFAQNYWWHSAGSADGGQMIETYSGQTNDAHVVDDGWHNLRIQNSFFEGAVASDTFIRVMGTTSPNTLISVNNQYNQQGNVNTNHWLEFVNCSGSCSGNSAIIFSSSNDHIETIGSSFISSDASWVQIQTLLIGQDTFFASGGGPAPFFGLNVGTQLTSLIIHGSTINSSTFTLAPTAQFNYLNIDGNTINSPVSVTSGNSGSTGSMMANHFYGGLTLSGPWASLHVGSGSLLGGSLSNSASGNVVIDIPNQTVTDSRSGTMSGNWTWSGSNTLSGSIGGLQLGGASGCCGMAYQVNNAGATTGFQLTNGSIGAGVAAQLQLVTGTGNSYSLWQVQDGALMELFTGSGLGSGMAINTGAGPITLNPTTKVQVNGPVTVTGAPTMTGLPTSAAGGGLFVCVDSAGAFYKKAVCP